MSVHKNQKISFKHGSRLWAHRTHWVDYFYLFFHVTFQIIDLLDQLTQSVSDMTKQNSTMILNQIKGNQYLEHVRKVSNNCDVNAEKFLLKLKFTWSICIDYVGWFATVVVWFKDFDFKTCFTNSNVVDCDASFEGSFIDPSVEDESTYNSPSYDHSLNKRHHDSAPRGTGSTSHRSLDTRRLSWNQLKRDSSSSSSNLDSDRKKRRSGHAYYEAERIPRSKFFSYYWKKNI